jgi:competence protein ComGC
LVPSEKCQTAVAVAVNVPALLLLIVTVQLAVFVPNVGVAHVSVSESGVGETLGVIEVNVAVEPVLGDALVVIVNVCA